MRPRRYLYIVTAAEFGGPSRHVLWLAEHLIAHDSQVGIVAAPEPRLQSAAQSIGATFFPNPYFTRPIHLATDARSLGPVFRAIRSYRPDLVSAHSTKAGYAARLCSAMLGLRPVLFTAHGWSFSGVRNRWKQLALVMAERLAARVTSKLICVSDHDRKLALHYKVAPADKLLVILNGVDPGPFVSAEGRHLQQELRLGGVPTVIMVARLVPQKDPLTLLQAFLLVEEPFKLLLVGDGELRPQVQSFLDHHPKLRDSVLLLGEREDIPDLLVASDMFVLSSLWEGLPRAVIEAMMAGLPVVATAVAGTPELVVDGTSGFLVPPEQPEALARSLSRLLRDASLRRRMGEAGRARALAHFSLNRMLQETQSVYDALLAGHKM